MQTKKVPKGLPGKCLNLKAPYMPTTSWWCTLCAPTGGRLCWQVCKMIGEKK